MFNKNKNVQETATIGEEKKNVKKPFYKKWWFWVVIVIVVVAIASNGSDTADNDSADNDSVTSAVSTNKNDDEVAADAAKEVDNIAAAYTGSTEAGTIIDSNSDFTVTAQYVDGSTETVSGWEIAEPVTLYAGQTSTVTISYQGVTVDVNITCTTIDEASFKASCQNVPYEELARNGDNCIGTAITFRGQIIQVLEGDGSTTYRINVTPQDYGLWDDTMLVQYSIKEGQSRFLEDDIVTVYGTCMGLYSYETVLGSTVTVPSALAEFMELS